MTFKIEQNNEIITLNSFDEQYCVFTGTECRDDQFALWFPCLESVFNLWGDVADNSNQKYSRIYKKLNIKDSRSIPAKDAAHCLMVWATLNSKDTNDSFSTLNFVKPVVDFFNSLSNTKFYFSF